MDYFTYLRGMEYGMPNQNSMSFWGQSFGYNLNSNPSSNIPWPLDFQSKSVQYNLNNLINGVKNSIETEMEDEFEYTKLAQLAPNEEQREIIDSIKENEMIHHKIFRKIFTQLTGVVMPETVKTNMPKNTNSTPSYTELLTKALMGELKAIERYRELMAYAPNMEIYNMLMYVLTDEIRHAIKYQYLLMLNK